MADERIIRIKIEDGGISTADTTIATSGEDTSTGKSPAKTIRKVIGAVTNPLSILPNLAQSAFDSAFIGRVVRETEDILVEALKYSYTRRWQLEEDYVSQNNYANAWAVWNKSKSIASQIGSWTIAGAAVGGGVGSVIGTSIGTIVTGIKEAQDYQKKNDAMVKQLTETSIRTTYSAKRLGLIDNSRGTEN